MLAFFRSEPTVECAASFDRVARAEGRAAIRALALIGLGSALLLGACGAQTPGRAAGPRPAAPPVDSNAPIATLRVGLYPFVPRLERFEAVIRAAWRALQPRVALEFAAWDGGYAQDPAVAGLDVFVF